MKKFTTLLVMSAIGLAGTLAWAGSAREDSVDRLDRSVNVIHAIMATPDKGIPEEVLSGGSWGLQIGVEDIDLVMLIMNNRGMQHLLSSKFELSGEGSVAAGPVGRHASAGTDWKMNTEALTYSRSKGVFAGLTLEGAVVEQDNDSTRAIYGKHMSFRNILSGRAAAPPSADAFLKAVSEAGQQAHVAEAKTDSN
jgi:lipid-binding SYLF domain-containing protein